MQTRQPLRTLANPAKGPITSVLVMDRPPFLVPGTDIVVLRLSSARPILNDALNAIFYLNESVPWLEVAGVLQRTVGGEGR